MYTFRQTATAGLVLIAALGAGLGTASASDRSDLGTKFDISRSSQCSCTITGKSDIKDMIIKAALRHDVPPSLALAVGKVESNYRSDALSHAGARGVMQIMPATAKGEFDIPAYQLWDAELNVDLGVRYLRQLYDQYGQRWTAALSHYNGGTLSGPPLTARPHGYTRGYVSAVLANKTIIDRDAGITARIATLQDDTGYVSVPRRFPRRTVMAERTIPVPMDDMPELAGGPAATRAQMRGRGDTESDSQSIFFRGGYTPEQLDLKRRFAGSL